MIPWHSCIKLWTLVTMKKQAIKECGCWWSGLEELTFFRQISVTSYSSPLNDAFRPIKHPLNSTTISHITPPFGAGAQWRWPPVLGCPPLAKRGSYPSLRNHLMHTGNRSFLLQHPRQFSSTIQYFSQLRKGALKNYESHWHHLLMLKHWDRLIRAVF